LSVYLQPEALRPTYSSSSSSSSIQDFTSTRSIAQQPLESKISSILYALERGHGTIATTIADIGMATHPTEAKHFLELSAVAKAQLLNDSEGAIKDASNALRLQPNSTLAKLVYAVQKFNQGDRLSAVSAMHDMSETVQLDKYPVDDSTMTYIISFLDILHQHDPADLRILQQRGSCRVATQDPQQAAKGIDDLTSAIDLGLNTASSFHYRAKAYMLLGKWEAAVEDLSTAHTLHPTDPVMLIERAAAKHHVADYAGSIQDYSLLQQLQPLSMEQLVSRARLKEIVGDDESSKKDYWKVVLHEPESMSDLIACANAKFAMGSFVGSLRDLDRADAIWPGQLEVLKLRGIVKFMLEDFEGFVKDLSGRTDDPYWLSRLAASRLRLKHK